MKPLNARRAGFFVAITIYRNLKDTMDEVPYPSFQHYELNYVEASEVELNGVPIPIVLQHIPSELIPNCMEGMIREYMESTKPSLTKEEMSKMEPLNNIPNIELPILNNIPRQRRYIKRRNLPTLKDRERVITPQTNSNYIQDNGHGTLRKVK